MSNFSSLNPHFPNDSMLPRERILKTLNHEEPDRVPITEFGMDSADVARYYGAKPLVLKRSTLKLGKLIPFWRHLVGWAQQNPKTAGSIIKGVINLWSKMGLDCFAAPVVLYPTKGWNKEWMKTILPDPLHYVDEFGRMFEFIDTRYGAIAYYKDGLLKTSELYDKFGPIDPKHPARFGAIESAIKNSKNKQGQEFIMPILAGTGVVEATWEGMGLATFSKAIIRDRPFIKRVMKDRADLTIDIIKEMEHYELPVMLIFDDYGYKQGPFMNPQTFRELVVPELKRIVNAAHGSGMKLLLHSCGNLNEILDDIVGAGIDGLHPLEPTAYMDIIEIKKKYGKKITLIGNVSPQDLQDKDPDYIRAYVRKIMEIVPQGGGYIFSSGHSINPAVGATNYVAMREEFSKHCYYKK